MSEAEPGLESSGMENVSSKQGEPPGVAGGGRRWAGSCERRFNGIEQALDYFFNRNRFGFRAVIQQQPMTQRRECQRADIFDVHMGAIFQEGAGLGAEDQELGGAGTGAPTDPFIDKGGAGRLVGA